jgi:hypothetical protein
MTSTLTQTTTTTIPVQRRHSASPSRRTTWVVAGAAAVAIAAAGGAAVVLTADDPPAPTVTRSHQASAARADAEESSHGFGPVTDRPLPVARRTETAQLVHGTAGSLRDAAGRPLAF